MGDRLAEQFDQPLADQLVILLPLAYARVWFANTGAPFSDAFCYTDGANSSVLVPLHDLPVWPELLAFATQEASERTEEEMLLVAGHSAEFKVLDEMSRINPDYPISAVKLSPLAVSNDYLLPAHLRPVIAKRPWWKFWGK